jgi:NTE family protein
MQSRPDVLVLGVGGVLGEAWMTGVLAGIEDATGFDLRGCEHFVGTSAGSIVAARLVAGSSPARPVASGRDLEPAHSAPPPAGLGAAAAQAARRAGALALAASAPFTSIALGIAAPGGALMRAALLSRLPRPRQTLRPLREEIERSGATFDGRLRVVAVDRGSGRRVVFGRPQAPAATVGEAVVASCTVPWLFAPVWIDGREYVDGGVWSPTNLDVAPAGRDTHVLCLNATAGITGTHSLVTAVRGVARSAVSLEATILRRRGVEIQTVIPDAESAATMGSDFMKREPRGRVLAAGYRQGLALAASYS